MSKQRAFVRYIKSGNIVPGSLILTNGSYPSGPGLWKEITTDLCCENNNTMNYKVYTAAIKQIDTDAPEAIILENTLDETPVWSRDGAGLYKLSAVNEIFKTNKTICFIGHNYDTPLAIWQFGRGEGNGPDTERVVFLQVYSRADGTGIDISSAGSLYYDTYVEIRVYP